MKQLTFEQAYKRIANLCSKSEKCKSDIKTKLKIWKINSENSEEIISLLEKYNFINEKRYARFFVKDKLKFNKWGRLKIRRELENKKIPEEYIKTGLDEINHENYINILTKLLNQKAKTIKESDNYKKKIKLVRYASGKGFESEIIFKILNFS